MNTIRVSLDAELICHNTHYAAIIENISEHCLYVKIAHLETEEYVKPEKWVCLKFRIPTGKMVHLYCKKIWSDKNTPNSLIERLGVKIINPPPEYKKFYQCMSHRSTQRTPLRDIQAILSLKQQLLLRNCLRRNN